LSGYDEGAAFEKLRVERATERRLLIARMWDDFVRVKELSAILGLPCPKFAVTGGDNGGTSGPTDD
jgi:hypothetical protein